MPSPVVSRASLRPSIIVLALVAVSAAGCSSDTGRFDSNPFASKQADVTGSVNSAPPSSGRIESKPLAAPGQSTAMSSPGYSSPAAPNYGSGGVAGGGRGMSSYQPAGQQDVTGTVASQKWDWNGGTAIVVAQGDTMEILSRRHNIPASAIMQANGLTSTASLHPGQRLVIPRYSQAGAAHPNPAPMAQGSGQSATHTVSPGETMTGIARRYNVALKDLAKANNIEPYTQVKMGDKLVIPGRTASIAKPPAVAAKPAPTQVAQAPKTAPAAPTKVASTGPTKAVSEPKETAVLSKPDVTPDEAKGSATFRWPVRGRIIAGFGPKPNGQQNDGINLSVPEGTPIKAAEDGVVAYAGNELKGYGNLVLIRHSNGFVTAYAHASELMVKRGDTIKRGQTIAKAGQTGTVTSPQVHFEIRKGSSPVDPTQYLNGA